MSDLKLRFLLNKIPHNLRISFILNCTDECGQVLKEARINDNYQKALRAASYSANSTTETAYYAAYSALYYAAQALNLPLEYYEDKLLQFISKLTKVEKEYYNINI